MSCNFFVCCSQWNFFFAKSWGFLNLLTHHHFKPPKEKTTVLIENSRKTERQKKTDITLVLKTNIFTHQKKISQILTASQMVVFLFEIQNRICFQRNFWYHEIEMKRTSINYHFQCMRVNLWEHIQRLIAILFIKYIKRNLSKMCVRGCCLFLYIFIASSQIVSGWVNVYRVLVWCALVEFLYAFCCSKYVRYTTGTHIGSERSFPLAIFIYTQQTANAQKESHRNEYTMYGRQAKSY